MNPDYSNREIDEKFSDIQGSLGRIEVQTTKTNGSVAEIKAWKEQMVGGSKVAIVFMTIITGAMGWLTVDYLNHRNDTNDQLQAAVEAALKNYQVNVK